MTPRERIDYLVRAAAPYWAAEAEVVRTYWDSPVRTLETDLLWLRRQSFKEFWGKAVYKAKQEGIFHSPIKELARRATEVDETWDRHEVLDMLDFAKAEFSHYVQFSDVHDKHRPSGTRPIRPADLVSWAAEDELGDLRGRHCETHGELGQLSLKCTEGGYCALFREGMALKGRGGIDDDIADACRLVYEDEFDHMLTGLVGVAEQERSMEELELLVSLTVEQLKGRIVMRNEQFSKPVSQSRLNELLQGGAKPMSFDYQRAGLAA